MNFHPSITSHVQCHKDFPVNFFRFLFNQLATCSKCIDSCQGVLQLWSGVGVIDGVPGYDHALCNLLLKIGHEYL